MIFFGKKIALKRLHVVIMAKDEYVSLQKKVRKPPTNSILLSQKSA